MPRVQVYMPEDLYREMKKHGLPASELLQEAVRAELRRLQLAKEADRYIEALERQVPEPTPDEQARADAIARRIAQRRTRRAG